MKSKKIQSISTKLPKKSAFTIDTDPDFIKLHTLCVINGKRGGGKTVALCNLLREAKAKHYYDRVFVITPTYNSNKQIWDIANIPEEDIIEPSITAIHDTVKRCEAEKNEWDEFLAKKQLYEKFKKDERKPVHKIMEDDLVRYYEYNFYEEKPEWKYPVEQPPRLAVVLDDCLNSDVMARRSSGLTNLAIRHRHICDGLGISLFMLVQSYCAQGGVPRVIRENTTHLMLFKINDEKQIAKIKEESDLDISDEQFNEMLNICHSEPYQFLMIDFSPKCNTKKYRKGFNEFLIPEGTVCECKK